MKNIKSRVLVLVLVLICLFNFTACGDAENQAQKLDTPTGLYIDAKTHMLTWDPVSNTDGYIIVVDNTEYNETSNSFSLTPILTELKTYTIKVQAAGDGKNFLDSDFAEKNYSTYPGYVDDAETWDSIIDNTLAEITSLDANFTCETEKRLDTNTIETTHIDGKKAQLESISDSSDLQTEYVLIENDISYFYSYYAGKFESDIVCEPGTGAGYFLTEYRRIADYSCLKGLFGSFEYSDGKYVLKTEKQKYLNIGFFDREIKEMYISFYEGLVNILYVKYDYSGWGNGDIKQSLTFYTEHEVLLPAAERQLAAPSNVVIGKTENSDAFLTWDSVENADMYEIYVEGEPGLISIGVRENSFALDEEYSFAFSAYKTYQLKIKAVGNRMYFIDSDFSITLTYNKERLYDEAGLEYRFMPDKAGYSVSKGNATVSKIIIPETFNGRPVVAVSDFRFYEALTEIKIPASVKKIDYQAFYVCTGLINVEIAEGLTHIDSGAFENCGALAEITIPASVISIGGRAFYGCTNLQKIVFRQNSILENLGYNAFKDCAKLTDITLPDNVLTVSEGVFLGSGWYTKQPDGFVYNGKALIGYKGTMPANTKLTIMPGTKTIADKAFMMFDELTEVSFPDSLLHIGQDAFYECANLNNFTLPSGLLSIGAGAFRFCAKLTKLTIPEGVTEIENDTFFACGLTEVTLPSKTTVIGEWAFAHCNIKTLTIPASVLELQNCSFYNCALENIVFEEGSNLQTIGESIFYCQNLRSITIPDSVSQIGRYAFSGCPNLTIYVSGHDSAPEGWHAYWNYDDRPVYWNYQG